MPISITRVYTRTGDRGETALVGGRRVPKDSPRIAAYGTIDELNAAVGLARVFNAERMARRGAGRERHRWLDDVLKKIQNQLFDLGSELATPPDAAYEGMFRMGEGEVTELEKLMDHCQKDLAPLKSFTLPGGGRIQGFLHQARTVCRRAEREVLALSRVEEIGEWPLPIVDYLSLNPKYIDGTTIGGSSFVAHVNHAAAAIAEGRCRVALITYGSTSRSSGVAVGTRERISGDYLDQFEALYGTSTVGLYAMVARRHMHEYGTTPEQLAEIAVATRRHASLNPLALYRDPITVKDVLASPLISAPLHLLDCCVITDGGGALVVVHPDLARDLKKPPVRLLGSAEAIAHTSGGRRDFLVSAAAESGPRALAEAGLSHRDVGMALIFGPFTINVLVTLADLGFCQEGQGGAFVSGGRIALSGELPVNTDGGGLSSNHPGMRGIFLVA